MRTLGQTGSELTGILLKLDCCETLAGCKVEDVKDNQMCRWKRTKITIVEK